MRKNTGIRYSRELKESIVKRMMPPNNESVSSLCEEFGISDATLYNWRKEARAAGCASPGNNQSSDKWSSEDKFLLTYTLIVLPTTFRPPYFYCKQFRT